MAPAGLFHNYVILRHINHNKNVMREKYILVQLGAVD